MTGPVEYIAPGRENHFKTVHAMRAGSETGYVFVLARIFQAIPVSRRYIVLRTGVLF